MKKGNILDVDSDPALVRYYIDTLEMTQADIAGELNYTEAAVSMAINRHPRLKDLRQKIINLINSKNKQ